MFPVDVSQEERGTVLVLRGELDFDSAVQLDEAGLRGPGAGAAPGSVVVDLAALTFCDSSGNVTAVRSLLPYTDGITAARAGSGEEFGEKRLAEAVAGTPPHPSARQVVDALARAVRDFTGGQDVDDDRAVLVLTAT
ncbi:STAS domain-containing protein [Streptomyces sp. NRRL B-24572]|uniref:STAS domain-containing protein n=1 Tax=Streptomyces sp. NRRL B-24572 TaxID=1962156 RepID=UPI0015C4F9D2|nr:SpoIIE family protein phosphatase [Streptomyces sp. NRRL B-24572]